MCLTQPAGGSVVSLVPWPDLHTHTHTQAEQLVEGAAQEMATKSKERVEEKVSFNNSRNEEL